MIVSLIISQTTHKKFIGTRRLPNIYVENYNTKDKNRVSNQHKDILYNFLQKYESYNTTKLWEF